MAGFDAGGADHDAPHLAVSDGFYPLKIGIETTLVDVMGVADMAANHGLFSTQFTHL
jgi:hypothetical protein